MALSDQELIQAAFRYGHFHNPEFPTSHNVDESALHLLTLADRVVKDAMASWQMADGNLVALSLSAHKRPPQTDGDVGPATRALAELPRCPIPDHPMPPGATFTFADPGLQRAVESQQRAAAMGSGSWPSCDPLRPGVNSLRVGIGNASSAPATIKAYMAKALAAVVALYGEVGLAVRYVLDDPSADVEISKLFISIPGGVIGWNTFPQPNTCNQTIDGRLDTGYAPSDWKYWAILEAHESGHGCGLQHGRGHIMNPSIQMVTPFSWIGSYSFAPLKRYFGGEPLTPVPTEPPVPPDGETYWMKPTESGSELFRGTQSTGKKFLIVPNPLQ